MSAIAVARANIRVYIATLAPWLALSLAVAIPFSNSLTTIVTVLLALFCLTYMDGVTWGSVLKHPISIAILLLISISLIDALFSIGTSKQITLALRKSVRLLYFPLLLPFFANIKWRDYACIGFIASIFVSVLVAIWYGWPFFKDTIFTSLFVAYAVFLLAHYAYEYKNLRKYLIPLISFFVYYQMLIGNGRAGQILLICFALLFIWQRMLHSKRQILISLLLISSVVTACLLIPSSFLERNMRAWQEVQEYTQLEETEVPYGSSMGTRLILLHNTWDLIKMKPIFGWGTGAFTKAYDNYAPEAQAKDVVRANPHNQYLLTWMELGIPGLLALLWLLFIAAQMFHKSKNFAGYSGLGLVLAIAAGCCMNSWLLDFTSAFFFVYFMAVFAGDNLNQTV